MHAKKHACAQFYVNFVAVQQKDRCKSKNHQIPACLTKSSGLYLRFGRRHSGCLRGDRLGFDQFFDIFFVGTQPARGLLTLLGCCGVVQLGQVLACTLR